MLNTLRDVYSYFLYSIQSISRLHIIYLGNSSAPSFRLMAHYRTLTMLGDCTGTASIRAYLASTTSCCTRVINMWFRTFQHFFIHFQYQSWNIMSIRMLRFGIWSEILNLLISSHGKGRCLRRKKIITLLVQYYHIRTQNASYSSSPLRLSLNRQTHTWTAVFRSWKWWSFGAMGNRHRPIEN